ncbi:hypothetical protein cyc_05802 [Cyclospora cayetanensis]|uniref:Uncharacterized protein n=1 Tax=Cyclospora cayetanensis TaxID=88456 RepID=A0A1D3CVL8_9EIME|nr:hypothetical protein cyc_05802 [Cyclospora cayetanensis]
MPAFAAASRLWEGALTVGVCSNVCADSKEVATQTSGGRFKDCDWAPRQAERAPYTTKTKDTRERARNSEEGVSTSFSVPMKSRGKENKCVVWLRVHSGGVVLPRRWSAALWGPEGPPL